MKYKFILFLLFIVNLIHAQKNNVNYSIKWVDAKNGLNQLSVRYCVPDNNGFVWIATELGLYRYDGSNLKEINENKYPSLSKQRITRLGKDINTGKIYLQTFPENNQYIIDNNNIERVSTFDNEKNAIITFNNLSFTSSSSIIRNVLKHQQAEGILNEYFSNTSLDACLNSNFLFLPQFNHFLVFDKTGTLIKKKYSFSTNLQLFQFGEKVLAADKGKIFFISESKNNAKRIKVDAIFQKYLNRDFGNQSNIEIFGSNNCYYLKFKNKIFQIELKKDTIITSFLFDAPSDDITSICYLKKDNLYFVGTQTRGFAILKPIPFNTILFDDRTNYKSVNYCYSVAAISNNKWYSASGWTFNPKTLKSNIKNFHIENNNVRFILPYKNKFYNNSNNNLWDIESHYKIYEFQYPNYKIEKKAGFTGYTYYRGQLFLTDADAIYYLKNNTLKTDLNFNNFFSKKPINGICSLDNLIIIPTSKGVYKYSPENKTVTIVKGLENVNARYIKPINKQAYWVGCYGEGLFLVDKNKVYHALDSNIELTTTHAIEEDKQGNLWISTNNGLLKIEKQIALHKILNNQPITSYKYSTEDGLLTNEFNGGGTHPSLQTKEGILGFPSMKGFVWFNPDEVPMNPFNGIIVMDKVLVDDKKNISSINNSYFIPKETNFITLNFNYGYYYNRQNLTISYRFEDQNIWTEIKGNTFQIARYKKGQHKLYIKISTHDFSTKNDITQSFSINFEPRYYEMWWFWGICFFFFVIFIFTSYFIGLYISKRGKDKLKLKIDERTNELKLSVLELEMSKESLDKSLQVKNILLKEIHHRVKNNLQLVMSILNIQASDKENTSIEGFIEKGQSRIASMVLIHENLYQKEDIGNIDFETYTKSLVNNIRTTFGEISERIAVHINMKDVFFDVQTSIPIGLIINELVTNSFKHGFPNEKSGLITISIELLSGTNYKLTIKDTGIGFPKEKVEKKSIGLELVSLLVLQLKGKFTIDSKNGTVFEIIFAIP